MTNFGTLLFDTAERFHQFEAPKCENKIFHIWTTSIKTVFFPVYAISVSLTLEIKTILTPPKLLTDLLMLYPGLLHVTV